MRNPTTAWSSSSRLDAEAFDETAERSRAADDRFPERYQQVMAGRRSSGDDGEPLFKQVAETPKYAEAFRANKVCADWQASARAE